ncbi:MAG TPA: GFA family protein [Pararobbsia sp.]|nr:GFA family protein [Pararobbsia sp.]
MWVKRAELHVLCGEPMLATFDLGNGRQRRSKICHRCDTRLWAEPFDRPDLAVLRPGTLDDQHVFTPVAHLYTRSKQAWFSIPDNVVQFETQPAQREELIRLWSHARNTR